MLLADMHTTSESHTLTYSFPITIQCVYSCFTEPYFLYSTIIVFPHDLGSSFVGQQMTGGVHYITVMSLQKYSPYTVRFTSAEAPPT